MFLSIKRKIDYTFESVCFICLTIFHEHCSKRSVRWQLIYGGILKRIDGIYWDWNCSLILSAANVFYFQNYSIHLARHLIGQLFYLWVNASTGTTFVLSRAETKTTLHNSMYFYLKEQALVKSARLPIPNTCKSALEHSYRKPKRSSGGQKYPFEFLWTLV